MLFFMNFSKMMNLNIKQLKFISFTFHFTHIFVLIHVDYSAIRMKMKILSSTIHMQLLFQIKKKRDIQSVAKLLK